MGSHRFQTERFMSCKSSNSNPTWFFPTWNWVPTSIWGVKKSRVYSKKRSTSRSLLIWWWSTCLSFWGCFTWIGPRHPWQRPQETSCTVVTGLGWQPWNPTGRYLILFVIGYRTSWEYDHPLCIYIYWNLMLRPACLIGNFKGNYQFIGFSRLAMERVVDREINRKSEGIGGFSMFTSLIEEKLLGSAGLLHSFYVINQHVIAWVRQHMMGIPSRASRPLPDMTTTREPRCTHPLVQGTY